MALLFIWTSPQDKASLSLSSSVVKVLNRHSLWKETTSPYIYSIIARWKMKCFMIWNRPLLRLWTRHWLICEKISYERETYLICNSLSFQETPRSRAKLVGDCSTSFLHHLFCSSLSWWQIIFSVIFIILFWNFCQGSSGWAWWLH